MERSLWLGRLAVAVCAVAASAEANEWSIRKVATDEEIAPGGYGPNGAFTGVFPFGDFETVRPVINDRRDVAFSSAAALAIGRDPAWPAFGGVWVERGGVLSEAALASHEAPGFGSPAEFLEFSLAEILPNGDTLFFAMASGVGLHRGGGFWRSGPGGVEPIALTGGAIEAGLDGATHSRPEVRTARFPGRVPQHFVNDSGGVAFAGRFVGATGGGPTTGYATFVSHNGVTSVVASEGGTASGLESGETFERSFVTGVDNTGGVLAEGFIDGAGKAILWKPTGEPTRVLWRTGDSFQSLGLSTLNNTGGVAFYSSTGANDIPDIVLRGDVSGAAAPVFQPGDAVTGILGDASTGFGPPTVGAFYGLELWQPRLNDAGDLAFEGEFTVEGGSALPRKGLWIDQPGKGPRLIAADWMPTPDGSGLLHLGRREPSQMALNERGEVAFVAWLGEDPLGVTPSLWFDGPAGLVEVARAGDTMDLLGAPREISGFGSLDLNDRGQIVYTASFTDGVSGVFVATLVPEPAAVVLAAMGLAGVGRRRVRSSPRTLTGG